MLQGEGGYYVYDSGEKSGEEELHGPYEYSSIEGLPCHPSYYMGFQPSFDRKSHLLTLGNLIVFVCFKNKKIQVERKEQSIMPGGTVWSIQEIAQGTVACGFINTGTIEIYEGGKLIQTVVANI